MFELGIAKSESPWAWAHVNSWAGSSSFRKYQLPWALGGSSQHLAGPGCPTSPLLSAPIRLLAREMLPLAGSCFREALASAMTQKRWRQKCGNQRLPKDLPTDWLQMFFLSATGLSALGQGGAELPIKMWRQGIGLQEIRPPLIWGAVITSVPREGPARVMAWPYPGAMADCFYSREWLYAGSSYPACCSFKSSPESRPQIGRPGVREESPEASPAPGDGESGAHLKVTVRPTTSHLPAAHPESMPRFLLHFCSYTTAPQTSLVVAIDPWPLPSGHLVVTITYQWGGVRGQGWQMRQTHFADEERHYSSDVSSVWQTEPRLELLGKQLNCIESPISVWELEESMTQRVPGFVKREKGTIHVSQAMVPRRTETLGTSAPWTRPMP